jgi:hypothetical protein
MLNVEFNRNSDPITDEELLSIAEAIQREADPLNDLTLLLAKMVLRIRQMGTRQKLSNAHIGQDQDCQPIPSNPGGFVDKATADKPYVLGDLPHAQEVQEMSSALVQFPIIFAHSSSVIDQGLQGPCGRINGPSVIDELHPVQVSRVFPSVDQCIIHTERLQQPIGARVGRNNCFAQLRILDHSNLPDVAFVDGEGVGWNRPSVRKRLTLFALRQLLSQVFTETAPQYFQFVLNSLQHRFRFLVIVTSITLVLRPLLRSRNANRNKKRHDRSNRLNPCSSVGRTKPILLQGDHEPPQQKHYPDGQQACQDPFCSLPLQRSFHAFSLLILGGILA